jgi:hypothetical protein
VLVVDRQKWDAAHRRARNVAKSRAQDAISLSEYEPESDEAWLSRMRAEKPELLFYIDVCSNAFETEDDANEFAAMVDAETAKRTKPAKTADDSESVPSS